MTCCLLFSETGADPSWHQSSVRVCSSTFKSQPVKIVMRSASSVTVYTILSPVLFFQCPHEAMCPKLAVEHVTPCNFRQLYQPLPKPGVSSKSGLTLCVKHSIASYTRIQTMKILFITQSNLNTHRFRDFYIVIYTLRSYPVKVVCTSMATPLKLIQQISKSTISQNVTSCQHSGCWLQHHTIQPNVGRAWFSSE